MTSLDSSFFPYNIVWVLSLSLESSASPFTPSPSHSGTLEFPALPFTPSPTTFGHARTSSVTFYSFSHHIRARWNFQRYLLLLLPPHSGTLEFPAFLLLLLPPHSGTLELPALPFTPSPTTFGHARTSSVIFYSFSHHIRARWNFQRYLLLLLPPHSGTLEYPACLFHQLPRCKTTTLPKDQPFKPPVIIFHKLRNHYPSCLV